ncbi:MAG: Lrp/AsnC family transcriptional regulator [Candidatus Aenigmatarchaeota archaeon]
MLYEKLGIDERDAKIISWYMEDPFISQSEISKRLKLSQPSINVRIQKLIKKGILKFNVGMDFNSSNLFLTRVDLTSKDPHATLEKLKACSFFVNGFIMSGKNNLSIFIVNEDLRKIDEIINEFIRSDHQVSDINVNVVVSSAKEFIFNMNLSHEATPKRCFQLNACKDCKMILDRNKPKTSE